MRLFSLVFYIERHCCLRQGCQGETIIYSCKRSYRRLTKSKKFKKSAKERHDQALAHILKFYENPNPNWKMITDDKAHRDKLKSLAPKMKFGAKDLKKLKKVKDGRPSMCQRCKKRTGKKCPTMCKL